MTIYTSYIGKETKQNTTVEERQVLKEPKTNSNTIVKPLDKCKSIVIMDREVYTDKAQMVLNDPDAYDKLKRDPTR